MKRKIPPKRTAFAIGDGPHWDEVNVLRRKLGAHGILLAVIDEKCNVHVTGQSEPQAISLLGAAAGNLRELAHTLQHIGMDPASWKAEEMSDARVRRPPQDPDGTRVPSELTSTCPPELVAKAAILLSPKEWTEKPKKEEPD